MKSLIVANREFLVDDSAADAVIHYAAVLADAGRADTVELEVVTGESRRARISVLLNSGTQLASSTVESDVEAPDNDWVVDEIWKRIAALKMPHPISGDEIEHYVDLDRKRF
jgi:hypothetical protein